MHLLPALVIKYRLVKCKVVRECCQQCVALRRPRAGDRGAAPTRPHWTAADPHHDPDGRHVDRISGGDRCHIHRRLRHLPALSEGKPTTRQSVLEEGRLRRLSSV